MIKLNGKYNVPNVSDLAGKIWYTKNIELDEEGYIKLSARTICIQTEKSTGNLRLPLALGKKNTATYVVPSTQFALTQSGQKGYWVILSENQITFNVDIGTGVPTLTVDSHGRWFHNLWHVTDATALYTKASIDDAATYTSVASGLTSGVCHCIEVFKNRDTICVANGNVVKQYTNAYAASIDLTIPTDYEIIGLSCSNGLMAVLTMLSDSASGQNQEALFYTWDGSTLGAATPGAPLGSDKAIALEPYLGSWVILTRDGQLKVWTGGGFKVIASFPFYFKDLLWGTSYTRDLLGDVMKVDGDVIYINMNAVLNASGPMYETYLQNNPGGIWCYDPNIGLYHKYSPSISPANILTVTSANVNTTTDILTVTAGTIPSTGSPIKYVFDRAAQIGGLTTPTVYYCIKLSASTLQLAETKAKALAGVAINFTSTGAANNYFLALEVYDYGAQTANKSGAIALFDVDSSVYQKLIFGSELNDFDGTGNSNVVCVICDGFENRGVFVTPKIVSSEIQDILQKMYASYRPLKTGDSIIYKYQAEELLNLPVSSAQARTTAVNNCVWTGANAFSTTTDLSAAKAAFDLNKDLELEVISGAGAGTYTQIEDIAYSAGTYAVTMETDVDGASSGRYCDVIIDHWKVLKIITSGEPKNLSNVPGGEGSNWWKIKGILSGTDVAVFDQKLINAIHQKAT